jgi:hypothetical protein
MTKTKLADAILERGDVQKKIEQLKTRLSNNALYQKDTKTPESPKDILSELDFCFSRLELLINTINEANNISGLYKLLAKRDVIKSKLNAHRNFLSEISSGVNRYSKTEIAILPNFDAKIIQKEIDILSKEFRLTDSAIQSKNWEIEVEI